MNGRKDNAALLIYAEHTAYDIDNAAFVSVGWSHQPSVVWFFQNAELRCN